MPSRSRAGSGRRTWGRLAPAVLCVLVAGCGSAAPDYRAIWTSGAPSTSTTAATAPAEPPQPLSAYLESVGVRGRPVAPDGVAGLTVQLTAPPGWRPRTGGAVAPTTRVIDKGTAYPTATLLVFELSGVFDVDAAIQHADADARLSDDFRELNRSTDKFHGFPSSMIEGTYNLRGVRMQTYNRVVFATGAPARRDGPPTQYLVQFTVTTLAAEARSQGPDVEAVITGFSVKPA